MNEMAKISDETLPKDMDYAWSGTSLQEQKSSGQIGPILAMALTFVYLFLVALYESWTLPIAVLLISPVALLGALFFQYVWGLSLDVYAQVGLVMLIGLSTKQAILIVEFAKRCYGKRRNGVCSSCYASGKTSFQSCYDDKHSLYFRFVAAGICKRCRCEEAETLLVYLYLAV